MVMRSLATLALALVCLTVTGCPRTDAPETVAYVDLEQYVGTWYEIARYPQIFELGLVGVTATYAIQDDGAVSVTNRGFRNTLDGQESKIHGTATVADPETNAKLTVRFDPFPASLFAGSYWIIDLDPGYQYAVVSDPTRKTLWILSRTPQMDPAVYDDILTRLTEKGFDISKLDLVLQAAP